MKRKIDPNKVYAFIGRAVVYTAVYATWIGMMMYGILTATTLN